MVEQLNALNKETIIKLPSFFVWFKSFNLLGVGRFNFCETFGDYLTISFDDLKQHIRSILIEKIDNVFNDKGFLKTNAKNFIFDVYKDSLDFVVDNCWQKDVTKEQLEQKQRAFFMSTLQVFLSSGIPVQGVTSNARRAKTYFELIESMSEDFDDMTEREYLKRRALWWNCGPFESVVHCCACIAAQTFVYLKAASKYDTGKLLFEDFGIV